MKESLSIISLVILVSGIMIGFADKSTLIVLVSVIGGLLLLGISKIMSIAEGIHYRALQLPLSEQQLKLIMRKSEKYRLESSAFSIYPNMRTEYSLLLLDGEFYLNADAFHDYLKRDGMEYTFALPNQAPVVIMRSYSYSKGVELFGFQNQGYLMLKSIHVNPTIKGSKVFLEDLK
ncbi:hypothetical protein [Gorillibacterium massiliense]|uniref:hypothetical protein n=1 Tax=Gorillibacterium massiliense TaxID=1280390 RepID=UPI0005951DB5|nr:hypothetical protein [Gorillibacterium massiliense]